MNAIAVAFIGCRGVAVIIGGRGGSYVHVDARVPSSVSDPGPWISSV